MPYIRSEDRLPFEKALSVFTQVIEQRGLSNGELNYLMSKLALLYLEKHGTSYNTISDVVKTFECAKLEFYARVARSYEARKAEQNGDIYA